MVKPTYFERLQSVEMSVNFEFRVIEEKQIDGLNRMTQENVSFLHQLLKHFWSDVCFWRRFNL